MSTNNLDKENISENTHSMSDEHRIATYIKLLEARGKAEIEKEKALRKKHLRHFMFVKNNVIPMIDSQLDSITK